MLSGKIYDGTRHIEFTAGEKPPSIYVLEGEHVMLIVRAKNFPHSLHIPDFNISQDSEEGVDIKVEFVASKLGVFPMFCNSFCPLSQGDFQGQIVVLSKTETAIPDFETVDIFEAKRIVDSRDALVIDIRTPQEFFSGHLPGAISIPITQLEYRLREIEQYKNRDVLVYCCNGRMVHTAASILRKNGFTSVKLLSASVADWTKAGFVIER